jgi:hypothetical protein
LFNPAFTSTLLCVAVRSYQAERAGGMPILVSYLLLPIALHTETRDAFPATTRTSLTRWIGQYPQIHVGLAERVAAFKPFTAEAIRFGIAGGIVRLTDLGNLTHVPRKPRGLSAAKVTSREVESCFKVVTDLGRWFARVPDNTFLFRLLRIRP